MIKSVPVLAAHGRIIAQHGPDLLALTTQELAYQALAYQALADQALASLRPRQAR